MRCCPMFISRPRITAAIVMLRRERSICAAGLSFFWRAALGPTEQWLLNPCWLMILMGTKKNTIYRGRTINDMGISVDIADKWWLGDDLTIMKIEFNHENLEIFCWDVVYEWCLVDFCLFGDFFSALKKVGIIIIQVDGESPSMEW